MRSEAMHQRLIEWAAWFNGGGACGVGGWPTKNILHPSWLPPSGSSMLSMPMPGRGDARERETHQAIGLLTDKLIATVVVHYCKRWSLADQADQLGCSEAAIAMRIDRAHGHLHRRLSSLIAGV